MNSINLNNFHFKICTLNTIYSLQVVGHVSAPAPVRGVTTNVQFTIHASVIRFVQPFVTGHPGHAHIRINYPDKVWKIHANSFNSPPFPINRLSSRRVLRLVNNRESNFLGILVYFCHRVAILCLFRWERGSGGTVLQASRSTSCHV